LKDEVKNGNINYSEGDIVIPLSQPYRAFIKEVMEDQEYPVRHYTPGGEIIKPYDITSWSLPLHNGVESYEVNNKIKGITQKLELIADPFTLIEDDKFDGFAVFPLNHNESYKVAFTAVSMDIKVS
ncbi:MAG: hypothetical protein ACP5E3_17275, partial [Bacteroidales bacterium]